MNRSCLSLSVLLLASVVAPAEGAEAFKCKGSKGEVVFSDQPCKDGEKIELKPVQTYTPAPLPQVSERPPEAAGKAGKAPAAKAAGYDQILITAPLANEEIRDNAGTVTVSVALKPSLQDGHRLRLLFDGKEVAAPGGSQSWDLQDVERGEHTVQVEVLDQAGKRLQSSDTVKFAVHRRSLLNKLQREREAEQREKDKMRIALPRTGPRS